jgi:hypothetical protein
LAIHGAPRATTDVDMLIAPAELESGLRVAERRDGRVPMTSAAIAGRLRAQSELLASCRRFAALGRQQQGLAPDRAQESDQLCP